uniref:EKC/KEOPS complex subunit GON7 n=1 Tax=Parastrongyloides trichosuri TaxID=131310 RepID=A0A0N5A250_PARTI
MAADENAGSSIYQRQLATLQQKAGTNLKPYIVDNNVTTEHKSLGVDTNDLNDNVECVDMCIETDIVLPVDSGGSFTEDDYLPITTLKKILAHFKELISQTQGEIDDKKETIADLEKQLRETTEARDEFLNELENVLNEEEEEIVVQESIGSEVETNKEAEGTADEE